MLLGSAASPHTLPRLSAGEDKRAVPAEATTEEIYRERDIYI
jgi:hypothetical protein